MMDLQKCTCVHCGQHIEFPSEGLGMTVPCPTCEKPIFLLAEKQPTKLGPIIIPPAAEEIQEKRKSKQPARTNLTKLTEDTIRQKTKRGDIPLHRAAKNGQINQIPGHLLTLDLFLEKNEAGETPMHVAAKHAHLDQIPRQFFTVETLTVRITPAFSPDGTYLTGAGYSAKTETPLHIAARCGNAKQIPIEFFTPEFLSLEATGYRHTVLHDLALSDSLHLVPASYKHSKMWNLTDNGGSTPRDLVAQKIERENYISQNRNEPATEKQKDKLRWFGCTWDREITKGEASDAIDECVSHFPLLESQYYNRPATEEQLAIVHRHIRKSGESLEDYTAPDKPLTYGEAKELISESELQERQAELDELAHEYIIDVEMWAEIYPGLTWKKVQAAAKALDETSPHWREDRKHIDIMLGQVAQQNQHLYERWKKKGVIS